MPPLRAEFTVEPFAPGAPGPHVTAAIVGEGTAIAGTDYTAVSGTLSWAGGDTSSRSISIPILPAGGGKSFTLRLSSPTGGAFLGVNQVGRFLPCFGGAAAVAGNGFRRRPTA